MTIKTENLVDGYTVETELDDVKTPACRLVVSNTERDLEWLARDIFSTDYATILVD